MECCNEEGDVSNYFYQGHKHDQQRNLCSLYFIRCFKDLYFYTNHVSFQKDAFYISFFLYEISGIINIACFIRKFVSEPLLIFGAFKLSRKTVDVSFCVDGFSRVITCFSFCKRTKSGQYLIKKDRGCSESKSYICFAC